MATLSDRIDVQAAKLAEERSRIESQYRTNLSDVDRKIAALDTAKKLLSKELQSAYDLLLSMNLIREV